MMLRVRGMDINAHPQTVHVCDASASVSLVIPFKPCTSAVPMRNQTIAEKMIIVNQAWRRRSSNDGMVSTASLDPCPNCRSCIKVHRFQVKKSIKTPEF